MPTIEDVEKALQRCLNVEVPVDYSLSADASQLSTVYAEMAYFKEHERALENFEQKQRTAFARWSC